MKTRSYLFTWFISSISIFILTESNYVNINNSFLYSQEIESSLILKKGNDWIEIKQGDVIYVRSFKTGTIANRKPNKLPGSTLGTFTAAKPSIFIGLDSQRKILVTEFENILLSDIYSIAYTSDRTMAFRFAPNNFAHGFIVGALFPLTLFLAEETEGPPPVFILIIFSSVVGVMVGVPSAVLGLIHGLSYPNIESEFIIGSSDWSIVEE